MSFGARATGRLRLRTGLITSPDLYLIPRFLRMLQALHTGSYILAKTVTTLATITLQL